MREVKAQALTVHVGSLLCDILSEDLLQRVLEKVGAGMVRLYVGPAGSVNLSGYRVADLQAAALEMADEAGRDAAQDYGVPDLKLKVARGYSAGVADLAALLAVERGAVKDDDAVLAGGEALN